MSKQSCRCRRAWCIQGGRRIRQDIDVPIIIYIQPTTPQLISVHGPMIFLQRVSRRKCYSQYRKHEQSFTFARGLVHSNQDALPPRQSVFLVQDKDMRNPIAKAESMQISARCYSTCWSCMALIPNNGLLLSEKRNSGCDILATLSMARYSNRLDCQS